MQSGAGNSSNTPMSMGYGYYTQPHMPNSYAQAAPTPDSAGQPNMSNGFTTQMYGPPSHGYGFPPYGYGYPPHGYGYPPHGYGYPPQMYGYQQHSQQQQSPMTVSTFI